MSRSWFPGLALALVVLAASVAALLLAGDLAARDEQEGAPLRPATTSQPLRLAEPRSTPEHDR
jgi:hypothetical protein